jgi:hypothetical protein
MQNKANFLDALMNGTSIMTVDYENNSNWTLGENKPNFETKKCCFIGRLTTGALLVLHAHL